METKNYRISKKSPISVPLLIHAVSQQAPKAAVKGLFPYWFGQGKGHERDVAAAFRGTALNSGMPGSTSPQGAPCWKCKINCSLNLDSVA